MDELDRLAHEYWEFLLRENPVWATYLGDHRYDDRLADPGPEGRERIRDGNARFLRRAREAEAGITTDVLKLQTELAIEEDRHKFWQWAVDPMDGPQAAFPQILNYHPLRNAEDARNLAARFRAFSAFIDRYLENLREGVREGRVAAAVAVERVLGQLDAMLGTPPEASPFAQALRSAPAETHAAIREAIRTGVYAALERMRGLLRSYPGRASIGLGSLPDGAEAYRFRIRQHTTTELGAEEIHRIGLEELERIEAAMRDLGFRGDVRAVAADLRRDPANFFASREELERTTRDLVERIDAKLPARFDPLPRTRCEVRRIEEYREGDAPAAYYYPAPEDRSRPAIYYVNTHSPESRPRYNLPALTAHEAVPGHHLQFAIALETEMPLFRRHGMFTAYVEGWALYAELVADELGFYEDRLAKFGALTYQSLRACRLVVDTGIHAMGWSRDRALGFFREHLALSEGEIANEIDRYVVWPGQALAYMVGRREIQELRAVSERRLGRRFDVRAFHREVLRHGALPLSALRRAVGEWISRNE